MGKKKILKAEQKYTQKQLDVLAKFEMGPALDVSRKDAALLDAVAEKENIGVLDLCERFDEKPSRICKRIDALRAKDLLEYSEEDPFIKLTPLSAQFLGCRLKDGKTEKKFRKFIESLNEEELDHFIQLVDRFEIDETLNIPEESDEGEEVSEETEEPAETSEN